MVTTTKPKICCGNGQKEQHEVPKGTRMLFEKAIFEGKWGSWSMCVPCMDEWLEKIQ